MSQELPMQCEDIMKEIGEQIEKYTPMAIREAIAIQIHTARVARDRVEKEGLVVRDTKGSVIPHPAIKVEADAIKIYTGLISKYQG